jgi:hypothetical protein
MVIIIKLSIIVIFLNNLNYYVTCGVIIGLILIKLICSQFLVAYHNEEHRSSN